MSRNKTRAVLLAAVMVLSVAAPALVGTAGAAAANATLDVSVTQHDDGSATVSVTETENNNTSAVAGANVNVSVTDDNKTYAGSGDYVTDANGTVELPAPNQSVEVSVTASDDGRTASTTARLTPGEDDDGGNASAFGQRVSSFVHDLQSSNNTTDVPMGVLVANFVLQANPGNPPDHAGPPEWLTNDSVNKTTGPPEHAGPPGNETAGPPDDAGNGGGPPDDAGPKNGSDNGPPSDEEDEE